MKNRPIDGVNWIKFAKKFRQIDDFCVNLIKFTENFVKLTNFLKVALVFLPRGGGIDFWQLINSP